MILRFFPWKFFLNLAARRYDFLDPLDFLARLRSFAQPSEVQEPIELLRAGMVFHARGLVNTKAIQHNLDWVWPYWIVRQFNPEDASFIPRAFSFSHVNLTHRNWTAVGRPDIPLYPVVDPRGLVTPYQDGWSIDFWFYDPGADVMFPSQQEQAIQYLIDNENRKVVTECSSGSGRLKTTTSMVMEKNEPVVNITAEIASVQPGGHLVVALRPYNPEGVQFIESAQMIDEGAGWLVNKESEVRFSQRAEKILFSNYHDGDISSRLHEDQTGDNADCRIGMVTSAAFFDAGTGDTAKTITVQIPLPQASTDHDPPPYSDWNDALAPAAQIEIPDKKLTFLYDTAVRTLIHLSADDIVPGPYTYNRFWFRDACLMLHPMLAIGLQEICFRQLDRFDRLQDRDGFFHSQEGEWDANGQVLWLYNRYRQLTGSDFNARWLKAVDRGASWIDRKRVSASGKKYNGLLPPGFSAEHFGPNDYYYWDDFWAVAGLDGAAEIMEKSDALDKAEEYRRISAEMKRCLFDSIKTVMEEKRINSIPVSPNRRMDSGAIGSLVADYPLRIVGPADDRIMATADYLMKNCLHRGCFFQDMIHSGINIYMTLMLAQSYLRAGDPRFYQLLAGVVKLASPTGQWPEAIHPITLGGCMGDGQHGWAAAEFVMLLRNMFVSEETGRLVVGRGIRKEWLQGREKIYFGPTLTPYGSVTISIEEGELRVDLVGTGEMKKAPDIAVEIAGIEKFRLSPPEYRCRLRNI